MENKTIEKHHLRWENIEIDIIYKPDYFPSAGVSHLEVEAKEPLPFTNTGYKSIWIMKGELDGRSIEQYVLEALNYDAKSKKWTQYLEQKKIDDLAKTQLALF